MARTPKPWFNTERKAYYATIDGKKIRLGITKKEADREFYRIMAESGRVDPKERAGMTVADACEAITAQAARHSRPATIRLYQEMLGPFGARFASRRLDSMRPDECIRFVSEFKKTAEPLPPPEPDPATGKKTQRTRPPILTDSTRALMFRYVKTLFRWARDTGIIPINPLASTPNPWRVVLRARPMTEQEYEVIMKDRKTKDEFKDVVEFAWRTGARPGEIAKIEARHLDARRPIVRLQPSEHKTGTKTGLQREIVVPADLMEKLRSWALERRSGPLFRRRNGTPWTQDAISFTFLYMKRRLKLPADCVFYLARHAYITRQLDAGVPAHLVAKLAGHTHAETIQRVYYHPDTDRMIDAAGAVDAGEADRLGPIREAVDAERRKKRSALRGPAKPKPPGTSTDT